MAKIPPNNRCELLIDDFIRLATEHLSTVEGIAITTTLFADGTTKPSTAIWKGYTCQPAAPADLEIVNISTEPTEFKSQTNLSGNELEFYAEDVRQVYAVAYPNEVVSAPIYGGVVSANTANTPNTSYVAAGTDARRVAEAYLGKPMSDTDWNNLIAAIFAEAGRNQTEEAYVAATILNRTRNNFRNGNTVTDILYQPVQFEAVTGSRRNGWKPSINFIKGPPRTTEISIYGALVNILPTVDKRIINFTSDNDCLYVECNPPRRGRNDVIRPIQRIFGRNYDYLLNLRSKTSSIVVGSTIFSQ